MVTIPGGKLRAPAVAASAILAFAFLFVPVSGAQNEVKWKTERSGKNHVLTPTDLPSGAEFALTIEPPFDLPGGDLTKWLESRSDREAAALGTGADAGRVTPLNLLGLDSFLIARTIRLTSGEQRLLACLVSRRPDGQAVFARVVSSPEESVYKKYLPEAMQGFVLLARKNNASAKPGERTATNKPAERKPPAKREGRDAYTRPGVGPKPSEILGIYLQLTTQFGYGGMLTES